MTSIDVAEMLERFASRIRELPGVSRRNPHAFVEAKSELAGELVRQAKELRTTLPRRGSIEPTGVIRPGTRVIGRREVRVEVRRRVSYEVRPNGR